MNEAATPERVLPTEIESLLAALMASEPPDELRAGADRLEAAATAEGDIPAAAFDELNTAIGLIRGGQHCPAVSALLAARAALTSRA